MYCIAEIYMFFFLLSNDTKRFKRLYDVDFFWFMFEPDYAIKKDIHGLKSHDKIDILNMFKKHGFKSHVEEVVKIATVKK